MQDAYVAVFQDVVSTAREQTGIEFPLHIEHYVVALLAGCAQKRVSRELERPICTPVTTPRAQILRLELAQPQVRASTVAQHTKT